MYISYFYVLNKIYNSMVKSILIYGAETWSLYEDDRRRINATEIWYDIFNCNWVATRWQSFSTHIHTNNTGNATKQTIHRTQKYIEQHKKYIEQQ